MRERVNFPPRGFERMRWAALPPALALSALCMAASLGQPGMGWLAWISLLPLLSAARSLHPVSALLAGGGWGLCFYAAAVGGAAPEIQPGIASLILLALVPAAYTFLGSIMTRALGFIPVMMALLWILAESAFAPLGLHGGLVAGAQVDGQLANWLAGLLGYVFVSSTIIYANALLLKLLGRVRLTVFASQVHSVTNLLIRLAILPRTAPVCLELLTRSHPRAPPVR